MPAGRERTPQRSTANPKLSRNIPKGYIHVDGAIPHTVPPVPSFTYPQIMQHPARRKPLRMDAQDGPWSVSVAENLPDTRTYSIYIQTPTHHLTLTRTASEVAGLHTKLTDAYPAIEFPPLPLNDIPTKRRSSFLHTLSRLANNSTKPIQIPSPSFQHNTSILPTPGISPGKERDDPFINPLSSPTATTTSLASYLTVISNHPSVRTARPWRRFVRVRTDDLESVRVERAIKRVRSDLGMHVPTSSTQDVVSSVPDSRPASDVESTIDDITTDIDDGLIAEQGVVPPADRDSGIGGLHKEGIQEEDEDEELESMREDAKIAELVVGGEDVATADRGTPVPELHPSSTLNGIEEALPTDPSPSDTLPTPAPSPPTPPPPPPPPPHPATRIPRSASADPDKASRLSRVWSHDDESAPGTPQRKTKRLSPKPKTQRPARKVVVDDFEMMRVLGKGCAGKVLLVRHRASANLYALKAITKRHVLAHQELQHTLTEQAVLKRMAHEAKDPFVVKLWWSFHDKENLFLVMDFHPGGDLATQLARWGRLGRDRARFYAAEIVEGVDGLHAAGVIYRDLKPENILIGADGHIVLTDFGLSKEFPRRSATGMPLAVAPSTPKGGDVGGTDGFYSSTPGTPTPATPHWMASGAADANGVGWAGSSGGSKDTTSTFCGTAEYLAPEVIQGLPYSYEVDWWSFGTMLYEMLTGITPFWANNHSDMYVRVLQDELQFPEDKAMDQDTKSLIRGLLQRNPALRMSEPRIKRHPYFSMIDWSHVYYKRYIPPYIPPIDPLNASDTQNFDEAFLDMDPIIDNEPDPDAQTDSERERSERDESADTPSHVPAQTPQEDDGDVFDGYSFKGRHSVILDDGDDGYEGHAEDEGEGEDEMESLTEPEQELASVKRELPKEAVAPTQESEAVTEDVLAPGVQEDKKSALETPTDEPVEQVIVAAPAAPAEPTEPPTPPPKTAFKSADAKAPKAVTISMPRPQPRRREKSGVPALDRHLSRVIDEDEEGGTVTERDEDDWDFVETPGGEDRNGAKGTSLFARGVVDRYRLAVFRKASNNYSNQPRSFSGLSVDSDPGGGEAAAASPTPSDKRRGRNTGLSLGKSTRQFLRARSPPSTVSNGSRSASRTTVTSSHLPANVSSGSSGLLTPSPSGAPRGTAVSPQPKSLKSKDSTTSMGSPSGSSDGDGRSLSQSAADLTTPASSIPPSGESNVTENGKRSARISSGDEPGHKLKKMKRYKEGAEKVLSLFGSPRQDKSQPQS